MYVTIVKSALYLLLSPFSVSLSLASASKESQKQFGRNCCRWPRRIWKWPHHPEHGILNSNQLFLFPSQPLTTMAERVRLHRSLRAKNCLGYIYIYISTTGKNHRETRDWIKPFHYWGLVILKSFWMVLSRWKKKVDVFVLNFLFVPRRAKFDRDRIKLKLKLNIPKLIFLIQFRSKIFRLLILSTIFKDNN